MKKILLILLLLLAILFFFLNTFSKSTNTLDITIYYGENIILYEGNKIYSSPEQVEHISKNDKLVLNFYLFEKDGEKRSLEKMNELKTYFSEKGIDVIKTNFTETIINTYPIYLKKENTLTYTYKEKTYTDINILKNELSENITYIIITQKATSDDLKEIESIFEKHFKDGKINFIIENASNSHTSLLKPR